MAIVLVGVPVWLVASTLFGWWAWHRRHDEVDEPAKFATELSDQSVESDLRKIRTLASPRGTTSEAAALGLTRMAAMIEGSLGESNAGYRIQKLGGPDTGLGSWPVLIAKLPGDDRAPLWVITGYDQSVEDQAKDDAAIAAVLAVANAVANRHLGRPVHFAFLPHHHEPGGNAGKVMQRLDNLAGTSGKRLQVGEVFTRGTPIELSQELLDRIRVEAR